VRRVCEAEAAAARSGAERRRFRAAADDTRYAVAPTSATWARRERGSSMPRTLIL
jgi:hypothetical protein